MARTFNFRQINSFGWWCSVFTNQIRLYSDYRTNRDSPEADNNIWLWSGSAALRRDVGRFPGDVGDATSFNSKMEFTEYPVGTYTIRTAMYEPTGQSQRTADWLSVGFNTTSYTLFCDSFATYVDACWLNPHYSSANILVLWNKNIQGLPWPGAGYGSAYTGGASYWTSCWCYYGDDPNADYVKVIG